MCHELGKAWRPDTELMEGLHKMLKHETMRAPAFSQSLLSSRIVNRFVLDPISHATHARTNSSPKWSSKEAELWRLCEQTASAIAGADLVMGNASRFALTAAP